MRAFGFAPRASSASARVETPAAERAAPPAVAVAPPPVAVPGGDAPDRRVQGAHPAHRAVRIGALLQQMQRERVAADDDGIHQSMRSIRTGFVHVDARGDEHLGHRHVAVVRGVEQRREPVEGGSVRVRAGVEQRPGDGGMRSRHGPHQRRAARLGRDGVDVRAVPQKGLDHSEVPGPRRGHQRRQAARTRGPRAGAAGEQLLDHGRAGILRRPLQRRHAVVVGRVDVGPGAQQQVDQLQVVPMRRPEQRGGAVRTPGVDVDSLGDECPHAGRIATGRSRDQSKILGRGRVRGSSRGQQP